MKEIEIQKRITITQKEMNEIIESYKKMPEDFSMGILEFSGNRDDIIREIEKLSEVGKAILLMRYKFRKWIKEQKKKEKTK